MALTEESIKAVQGLDTLTAEQITAITNLSKNDESATISKKVGEIYGGLDKDIFDVSGIEKPAGTKTYDYAKTVISSLAEKAKAAGELDTYKAKVSELEKAIKEGKGSESIVKQLNDAQSQVTQLQAQAKDISTEWEGKYNKALTDLEQHKIDSEFSKALLDIKFKEGITDAIASVLISNAKNEVLTNNKMDLVEVDGKKVTVWRDANGEILRNKTNGLNPYTTLELVRNHLSDAIANESSGGGAGTTRPKTKGGGETLGDAKTQIEADKAIYATLMSQGLVRGTKEFSAAQAKMRTDFEVNKLPLR